MDSAPLHPLGNTMWVAATALASLAMEGFPPICSALVTSRHKHGAVASSGWAAMGSELHSNHNCDVVGKKNEKTFG